MKATQGRHVGESSTGRSALDVKVINGLGAGHFNDTLVAPLRAAESYRRHVFDVNQTGQRCSAQGIVYEPLVFTCQGGIEGRAEAIISQIAESVAKAEETDPQSVKAEILERISLSIARHVARAITRRTNHSRLRSPSSRILEAAARETTDAEMEVDAAVWQ